MPSKEAKLLERMIKRAKTRNYDPLRPLIDEYLTQRGKSETRCLQVPFGGDLTESPRPPGRISPSSIGGCQKKATFKFIGVEGRFHVDPDLQLIFDDGNWRHLKWDWMFLDMEAVLGERTFKVLELEQRVAYEPLYIAGTLDAAVMIRGKKWVVDFKGANSFSWSDVYMTGQPKASHVWQLVSYMKARRIRRGMIVYENKNDQSIKVFPFEFSEDDWSEITAWASGVVSALTQKTLPSMDPQCAPGNAMYDQCPFTDWCYGDHSVNKQIRLAYKDFRSIDDHWQKGNADVEQD